jgi:hypothetical protein
VHVNVLLHHKQLAPEFFIVQVGSWFIDFILELSFVVNYINGWLHVHAKQHQEKVAEFVDVDCVIRYLRVNSRKKVCKHFRQNL